MKTTLLALGLALTALPAAAAQDGERPPISESRTQTDLGVDRLDKKGTNQTFNTGMTGEKVGIDPAKSQEATVKDAGTTGQSGGASASQSYDGPADGRPAGTGIATGFVAAGFMLGLLGLLVRKRGRRPGARVDQDQPTTTLRR